MGEEKVERLFEYLKCFRAMPGRKGLYQSSYVYSEGGEQLVDFVGRFQNINTAALYPGEKIGINLDVPHLNMTDRKNYREHFTIDGASRVADLWSNDIASFGYAF